MLFELLIKLIIIIIISWILIFIILIFIILIFIIIIFINSSQNYHTSSQVADIKKLEPQNFQAKSQIENY